MTTLAITTEIFDQISSALENEDETAWVLVARVALDGGLLLGRSLHPVPETAYRLRTPRRLDIESAGFVPAFKAAADDDGIPVFVHTHPGGVARPSPLDENVDRELRRLAHVRADRPGYAALIVSPQGDSLEFSGRVWLTEKNEPDCIRAVRVAGPAFRLLLATASSGTPAAIFERQVRAFGRAGQELLSQLRVGVVGAGGTGSPTIEQLARLGVGTIVALDDDTVDESNLTRIHESTAADLGTSKVLVAKRSAEAFGTGTVVEAIEARATTKDAVQRLATCDVVFGCTDDHAGRLILSRLAYQYLLPVIDCGVVIDTLDGAVRDITTRITVAVPGEPCLVCRGQVDIQAAGLEMRSKSERDRLVREGYARGLQEPAPAVIAFTTVTSALAVNEMLARLFGYGDSPPGQLLGRLHVRDLRRSGRPSRPGHYCSDPSQWALGDTNPPLGIVGLK